VKYELCVKLSLLLFASFLALLLLFGEEFADLLIPLPLSLNISSSILHVHLLLALPLQLRQPLLLLLVTLVLVLRLLLDKPVHALDLRLVLDFLLLDAFTFFVEEVDLILAELVLLVSKLLEGLGLGLHEFADTIAN